MDENGGWPAFGNAALVTGVLVVCGVFSLLYPRPTVSETEKRELAVFPTFSLEALFREEYTTKVSEFFADTFPMREPLVRLASTIRECGGVRFDEIRIHEGGGGEAPMPPPTVSSGAMGSSDESGAVSAVPPVADDASQGIRVGAVFIYKGRGYQIFGGTEAAGKQYAEVLNRYEQALGDSVRIYNLVVPSAIEFALPERYKSMTTPELPRLENIRASLDTGIESVGVYETLAQHRDEYLYFNTDHHWTSTGAYYAYEAFCKTAGFEPVKLESMEKRTLSGFLGTLYSQTQDSKLAENPDHVDYYLMPTAVKCYQYRKNAPFSPMEVSLYGEYARPINSYSVFLHGDFPLTRIDTDVRNGRKIAVVKESYGNAFVPFLVNHYEQVYVVDQRYFQTGLVELIQTNAITDLLFINNIFAAHTPLHINELARIMYQTYAPPPPPPPPPADVVSAPSPPPTDIMILSEPPRE